jgi:hypothetical protein
VLQDQVVQGPGDALPSPCGADHQLDQREGAAGMLGGYLARQRGGQMAPPGGRWPQRHPEGVTDQVGAVAGLGQDEARLAAQDPVPVGERAVIVSSVRFLGAQGLQLVCVRRGLQPVEQFERDLRLACHGSIFLPLMEPSANSRVGPLPPGSYDAS